MITKKGTVVSISGQKTVKVEVNDYGSHPKYQKRYRITKCFLVHDEKGVAKIGDPVVIVPCRSISKSKSWKLSSSKEAQQ